MTTTAAEVYLPDSVAESLLAAWADPEGWGHGKEPAFGPEHERRLVAWFNRQAEMKEVAVPVEGLSWEDAASFQGTVNDDLIVGEEACVAQGHALCRGPDYCGSAEGGGGRLLFLLRRRPFNAPGCGPYEARGWFS